MPEYIAILVLDEPEPRATLSEEAFLEFYVAGKALLAAHHAGRKPTLDEWATWDRAVEVAHAASAKMGREFHDEFVEKLDAFEESIYASEESRRCLNTSQMARSRTAFSTSEIDRSIAAMNVVFRRGPFAVADAAEACRNGEATPEQQKTIIEILDARYGL